MVMIGSFDESQTATHPASMYRLSWTATRASFFLTMGFNGF